MSAFIAETGLLSWIEIALLVFFTVFVLVSASACIRKRGHFDDRAQIPMIDEKTDSLSGNVEAGS